MSASVGTMVRDGKFTFQMILSFYTYEMFQSQRQIIPITNM